MNTSTADTTNQQNRTRTETEGATIVDRLVGLVFGALGCGAFYYLGGSLGTALGTSLLVAGLLLVSGKFKGQPKEKQSP
jgi:hypothetical protein